MATHHLVRHSTLSPPPARPLISDLHRLPLWLGAVNLVWATVLAPLLSRTSEPSRSFDLARHPHLFAAVFILPQLISIGFLVPASVITNMRYNTAFQQGTALSLVVAEASQAFDAGRMDVVERLSESLGSMTIIVEHSFDSMVTGWKIVWTIYGSLNVFLASVRPSHLASRLRSRADPSLPSDVHRGGGGALQVVEEFNQDA